MQILHEILQAEAGLQGQLHTLLQGLQQTIPNRSHPDMWACSPLVQGLLPTFSSEAISFESYLFRTPHHINLDSWSNGFKKLSKWGVRSKFAMGRLALSWNSEPRGLGVELDEFQCSWLKALRQPVYFKPIESHSIHEATCKILLHRVRKGIIVDALQ